MAHTPLAQPPTSIEKHKEIAVKFKQPLVEYFNKLSAPERVFIYYIYRASLPGNRIIADQLHRDAVELTEIFEHIVSNGTKLKSITTFDTQKFVDQATTYLIYLWSNHCQYFIKEHAHHKRTPQSLGLDLITPDALTQALAILEHDNAGKLVKRLSPSLFQKEVEPTVTVPDSIEQSAVNLYSRDFTNKDFDALAPHDQFAINAYSFIDQQNGKRTARIERYRVGGKYDQELKVSVHWLTKARAHAQQHPQHFDTHVVSSLDYLIQFLTTGDEELFRKHSIEWLKTNSRVDYTFGFIETYDDPKSYRGAFQAEVTIKTIDMNKVNALLPSLEAQLPFPSEFMRESLEAGGASVPNASINMQAFGSGDHGPMSTVAAYCLPNYSDIRSTHGSKQIIYHSEKALGEVINPDLNRKLFHLADHRTWLEQNDPDLQLDRDIWMLQVILHETLGHGSGKLTTHTFVKGENLTIEGKTYKVGDTIPVTASNVQQLLAGYEQTLEELRAEILALYTSIAHYDTFAQAGLLKEWPQKCSKDFLINELIKNMVGTAFNRLLVQQDDATEIAGDHARANMAIMNYLIDFGGIGIKEEKITIDGESFSVLGLVINDQKKVLAGIKQLLIEVQTIKSTGDFIGARKLIDTYGKAVRNKEHIKIMKSNRKKVIGDLKATSTIFPFYSPIKDPTTGEIIDIAATWPKNFVEQQMKHKELMSSCD